MQAERVILETDAQGNLIGLPRLPPVSRLEAIFLVLESGAQATERHPPAQLKDSVNYLADAFAPALSDEDWEASLQRTVGQINGDPAAFR